MSPDLLEIRLGELSDRIKRGREKAGLTLIQLGERSGVAPSTIQKIEARQMTPSIAVVLRIANGLGIESSELIAPSNPSRLDAIIQRAGQHAIVRASDDLTSEKLSADISGGEVDCWRISMAPRYYTLFERPQALDEQVVICERGCVQLDFGDGVYHLNAGDTLHCQRRNLHAFGNMSDEQGAFVIMGRLPHSIPSGIIARPE